MTQRKSHAEDEQAVGGEEVRPDGATVGVGPQAPHNPGEAEQPDSFGGNASGVGRALQEERQDDDDTGDDAPVYVYLIRDPVTGMYKIGQSFNPVGRIRGLAWVKRGLELVSTIATDDAGWLERYMHETFSHCRVRGEWFLMSAEEAAMFSSVTTVNSESEVPAWASSLRERNAEGGFAWGKADPSADVAVGSNRMAELSADGKPMPKRKTGRPKKSYMEKSQIVTTSLTAAQRAAVAAVGGGSAYRGLKILAERAAGVRE